MENLRTLNAIVLTALQHTTAQHVDPLVALRGIAALSILAAAWLLVVFVMGTTRAQQDSGLTLAQDSRAAYKAAAAAWIKARKSKS